MSRVTLSRSERTALESALASAAPPPDLTVSEWADRYFWLSPESGGALAKWTCYPYQRGILDAISDPAVQKISWMKAARVGFTKALNIAVGYHMHQDPCNMLLCQPTVEDAEGYSKTELAMLRDVPVLAALVPDAGMSKKGDQTILSKAYPGGYITLVGANSARGFRRITVRKVLFDEVDGYPPEAGGEGDQIELGWHRADTAWNRQLILGSTPTIKGASRIEASYEQSDMRVCDILCPFCQFPHPLEWANLDWKTLGTPDHPVFICPHCGKGFGYEFHRQIFSRPTWRATKPFTGHAGFHLWAAYSYAPANTWPLLVKRWHDCQGDRLKLRTFANTVWGETWEERGDAVIDLSKDRLSESWTDETLPNGIALVTCGVDCQDDRLELEVVGWGARRENWSVSYIILNGSPADAALWARLDAILETDFRRVDGTALKIAATCIDTGGHFSQQVYAYAHPRLTRHVWPIKGVPG